MPKVFLAEDDETMVSLLETLLKMEGFSVVPLRGDEDVVAAVQREKPDALVLDMYLPEGVTGLDVLKALRADPQMQKLRIIVCSGADKRDESLRAGADAFLLKPYMPDELLKLLRADD